jgi:inosine-uridine nucleoside N-ribohydrolase
MTLRGYKLSTMALVMMSAIVMETIGLEAQTAARKKVFIDQDLGGATGTDNQSILMLLQAPDIDVVGIGIVAGDGQVKASTQWTLRMLELTGYGHIPVAQGAKFPLLNSREETEHWEAMYGVFGYKGAWNPARYHNPDEVPVLPPGSPTIQPIKQHAALFLIDTVRKYPGEVILWCGGPLTNVALALALDPELPQLVKELVLMGAGFNVDKGGNHRVNGRREFNWWWDPEAVRMVMSAPWKKITITPVDISVKTSLSEEMRAQIAKSNSPTAQYLTKYSRPGAGGVGYMWDEIAAAAVIDPSIITQEQELQVNIDIDHGAGYGQTIFIEKTVKAPSWLWKVANVQVDLDKDKFYKLYVDLMSRASRKP